MHRSEEARRVKAGLNLQAVNGLSKPKIPRQFNLERPIAHGAFYPWVKTMAKWIPFISEDDLTPSENDLSLISKLAYQTDDLANNMADKLMRDPSLAAQLEEGLAYGIDRIDPPNGVLREFLEYYEVLPEKINYRKSKGRGYQPPRFVENSAAFLILSDGMAMSVGFFIGANYPAVGKSLVTTGSVANGSLRMKQTMKFFEDVGRPNAFQKHGVGVQACAKVRLAHAFARRQIVKRGDWNEDYYGVPISEFDNMIFLSGLFMSSMMQAKGMNSYVETRVRGIQYGLGAPPELLDLKAREIARFFVMCLAHLDDSPDTALQVVKNFHENDYFRPTNTMREKINREFALAVANVSSRVLYGDTMADSIGLRRWYRGTYLPWIAGSSRMLTTVAMHQQQPLLKLFMATYKPIDKLLSANHLKLTPSYTASKKTTSKYKGSFGMFKGVK